MVPIPNQFKLPSMAWVIARALDQNMTDRSAIGINPLENKTQEEYCFKPKFKGYTKQITQRQVARHIRETSDKPDSSQGLHGVELQ